ncbi:unnamed protein product [Ceutorhynchus assimilis]|uniref:Sodefrin-like factor n=1 Tax=Ceutorhynchus assimilis TaxID=467358 RepID=A0A9N9QP30_9CUCU|nr:unnamed protein product [Ceutorhynchus assimilis]
MKSLLISVFSLVILYLVCDSSEALTCYSCAGKGAACPVSPTQLQLKNMTLVDCQSVLSTNCAKYSVNLLNGEAYTYRACEPTYIGGTNSQNATPFCNFVTTLYNPFITERLVAGSTCTVCQTTECNT